MTKLVLTIILFVSLNSYAEMCTQTSTETCDAFSKYINLNGTNYFFFAEKMITTRGADSAMVNVISSALFSRSVLLHKEDVLFVTPTLWAQPITVDDNKFDVVNILCKALGFNGSKGVTDSAKSSIRLSLNDDQLAAETTIENSVSSFICEK